MVRKGSVTDRSHERLFNLKLELAEIEKEEKLIDDHLQWLRQVTFNI